MKDYPHRDDPGVHITTGLDLADEAAVRRFYASLPPLWASIHLAGGFAMSPVAETSAVDFADQFQMNALSAFLCSAAAIRAIRARDEPGPGGAKGGRIVNVAARPGLEPRLGSGMVAYATAKAAVAAMTEALAQETASEEIWINAVAPSILDTPANRAAMPDADHSQLGRAGRGRRGDRVPGLARQPRDPRRGHPGLWRGVRIWALLFRARLPPRLSDQLCLFTGGAVLSRLGILGRWSQYAPRSCYPRKAALSVVAAKPPYDCRSD